MNEPEPAVKRTKLADEAVAFFRWSRTHVHECDECAWWWNATLTLVLPIGEAVDLLDDMPVPDSLSLELDD